MQRIADNWRKRYAKHTRSNYTKCLRRFLRWLERVAAAPPSAVDAVPRVHQPQPRTSIATDEERRQILEAASPRLRFFLLLCADLGLRHRTAASITLANYNYDLQALSFYTKGNVHQTLPVTRELRQIIESLPRSSDRTVPIGNLLPRNRREQTTGPRPRFSKQWKALKTRAGIRADLRIHDLRRTVADDVWNATHDIRAVQAQLGHRSPTTTARYLADRITLQDLQPIMLKVQHLRELRQQQATVTLDPATGNCANCPAAPHCTPEARLCQRKEFDS